MARVLTISLSDLGRDARLDRQIEALAAEHHVIAAGFGVPRPSVEYVPLSQPPSRPRAWIARRLGVELLRTLRADHLAYWMAPNRREWLARLSAVAPEIVVANDLAAAPLAFAAAAGAPVILDLHEYAPREHEEDRIWRLLEAPWIDRLLRRYMHVAAEVTTVNDAIAAEYERQYGRRPVVITNAARMVAQAPSQVLPDRVRMVHHGGAVRSRGIEAMIDLMALLDERFTLDLFLVGEQPYIDELTTRAEYDGRIEVHPPLAMEAIATEINRFDIGLYLLAPSNFNNLYALPNKFFDFVQGRLAVALGPSPAMASIASEYGFGVVADSFDPRSLASRLRRLSHTQVHDLKQAAHRAASDLSAERNAERLRAIASGALCRQSLKGRDVLAPEPARP